jgi:hypothetical protein
MKGIDKQTPMMFDVFKCKLYIRCAIHRPVAASMTNIKVAVSSKSQDNGAASVLWMTIEYLD